MQKLAPEGRVSGAGRSCFGSGRRGNGDVDGAHFTERRERGVEIIVAADGENDEPFVEPSRRLQQHIADGELVLIQGAGHSPQVENAPEFNRFLSGFLSRVHQSVAAGD